MDVQQLCVLFSPPPAVKMDKKVQREKEEQKEVERIVGCRLLTRIASLVLHFYSSLHSLMDKILECCVRVFCPSFIFSDSVVMYLSCRNGKMSFVTR